MMKSKILKYAAAAIAVLVGLYVAAWFATAKTARDGIRDWIERQEQNGLTIATGEWQTTGFPGRVVITVPDIVVHSPVTAGDWVWRSAHLALGTTVFSPNRLTVDFSGAHSFGNGTAPGLPLWLTTDKGQVEIVLIWSGRVRHSTITASHFAVSLDKDAAPVLRVGEGRLDAQLLDAAEPAPKSATLPAVARVEMEALDATMPPGLTPLTAPITRAALTLEIAGAWGAGSLPQVLETWRTDGGTLEIRSAVLDWPPIRITGNGTGALDAQLQPTGAAGLKIQGAVDLLDVLVQAGVVNAGAAGAVRLGLALLMRPNAAGVDELSVPLTLQDRALSAGPLPLGTMPEIAWPPVTVP